MPDLQTGIQRGRTGGGFGAFFQTLGSELSKAKERREKEDIQRRKEEATLEQAIQTATQKAQDQEALERLKSQLKREEDVSFIKTLQGGRMGGGAQVTDRGEPTRGVKGLPIPVGETPTGEISDEGGGFRIEQITRGGATLKRVPTQAEKKREAAEKGRQKGIEEGFKLAEGLKRAAKRIGSITRQFNEALPSEERIKGIAVENRIGGLLATMGAKTGFKTNPKLGALQKTAKLQLRAILRDMGEGARLSDQDIKQNLDVIEQAGLTNVEREALVRTFLQTTVDSMDSNTLKVITEDKTTVGLLTEFGVDIPGVQEKGLSKGELQTPSGIKFRIIEE